MHVLCRKILQCVCVSVCCNGSNYRLINNPLLCVLMILIWHTDLTWPSDHWLSRDSQEAEEALSSSQPDPHPLSVCVCVYPYPVAQHLKSWPSVFTCVTIFLKDTRFCKQYYFGNIFEVLFKFYFEVRWTTTNQWWGVCFFLRKIDWTKFYKPFCLIGKTDMKQDLIQNTVHTVQVYAVSEDNTIKMHCVCVFSWYIVYVIT